MTSERWELSLNLETLSVSNDQRLNTASSAPSDIWQREFLDHSRGFRQQLQANTITLP